MNVFLVALYPVATAALWIAGGLLFKLWEEHDTDASGACSDARLVAVAGSSLYAGISTVTPGQSTTARPTTPRPRRSRPTSTSW